jgi:hypothetical protein
MGFVFPEIEVKHGRLQATSLVGGPVTIVRGNPQLNFTVNRPGKE